MKKKKKELIQTPDLKEEIKLLYKTWWIIALSILQDNVKSDRIKEELEKEKSWIFED